jgi:hypothetical protein
MTGPFFAVRMKKKRAAEDLIGFMTGDALIMGSALVVGVLHV